MDTKTILIKLKDYKKLNYSFFIDIPRTKLEVFVHINHNYGLSGGLWLIWTNTHDFVLEVILSNDRLIYCWIKDSLIKSRGLLLLFIVFPP